jgi:hypothetical protein
MIPGDPEPGWNSRTNVSGLITVCIALGLIAIGGQCRGSLAQQTAKVPLTRAWSNERAAAIEDCRKHEGIPVVIAGPVGSDGIGCAQPLGYVP